MQYREDRYGNKLSVLGYGCMRFRTTAGKIDYAEAEKEVMAAFHAGVNYFDTAYIYNGSEETIGKIFAENNIRKEVHITTKLPHYMIKRKEDFDRFFMEELRRLQTNYVDYYLLHMLTDIKSWEKLKALGILEWLEGKKNSGQIRQVGFSYHGSSDMFCRLIDAYDWDLCQIQYNYVDIHSQAGVTGLRYAASRGIPVMIMEPLRGGRLTEKALPEQALKLIRHNPRGWTPAEWGFQWLWDQKEVTVVLSGMNSLEMVAENCRSAERSRVGLLTEEDQAFLQKVTSAIHSKLTVGCTGCRYCMPCPQGVDIPGTFSAYNKVYTDSLINGLKEYYQCTAMRRDSAEASRCIECGKCERHCPQHIPIREELKNARKVLENPAYRIFKKVAGKVIFRY